MQVCAWVLGNDHTVAFSGATGGQFQLNIMMPVMGYGHFGNPPLCWPAPPARLSICVPRDMEPNPEACEAAVEKSLSMVTSLNPLHRLRTAPQPWRKKRSKPGKRSGNFAANKRSCLTMY